ncbi:hypothetical protein KDL29_00275 [bacterium]|nr:hypothetical protein [bacterium]
MTALLLICATLMAQGQPAQLPVRVFDTRTRQELSQVDAVQPLLRAQLRMLGSVDLHSLIRFAADSCYPATPIHARQTVVRTGISLRQDSAGRLLASVSQRSRAP